MELLLFGASLEQYVNPIFPNLQNLSNSLLLLIHEDILQKNRFKMHFISSVLFVFQSELIEVLHNFIIKTIMKLD